MVGYTNVGKSSLVRSSSSPAHDLEPVSINDPTLKSPPGPFPPTTVCIQVSALSGSQLLCKDALFVTLDPAARRLVLPSGDACVLSDTVRGRVHTDERGGFHTCRGMSHTIKLPLASELAHT